MDDAWSWLQDNGFGLEKATDSDCRGGFWIMLSGVTLWFNSPEKSTRVEEIF